MSTFTPCAVKTKVDATYVVRYVELMAKAIKYGGVKESVVREKDEMMNKVVSDLVHSLKTKKFVEKDVLLPILQVLGAFIDATEFPTIDEATGQIKDLGAKLIAAAPYNWRIKDVMRKLLMAMRTHHAAAFVGYFGAGGWEDGDDYDSSDFDSDSDADEEDESFSAPKGRPESRLSDVATKGSDDEDDVVDPIEAVEVLVHQIKTRYFGGGRRRTADAIKSVLGRFVQAKEFASPDEAFYEIRAIGRRFVAANRRERQELVVKNTMRQVLRKFRSDHKGHYISKDFEDWESEDDFDSDDSDDGLDESDAEFDLESPPESPMPITPSKELEEEFGFPLMKTGCNFESSNDIE